MLSFSRVFEKQGTPVEHSPAGGYNDGMSNDMQSVLTAFFAEYAARFNRGLGEAPAEDVEAAAAAFADCFIGAGPGGVMCAKNDGAFRAQLPQGFAFYWGIGTQSMTIDGLDITPLDDLHAMVRVHWNSRYIKQDGSEVTIPFDVIYLLQIRKGQPKIFAYITGDEMGVLKEHGLLPEEPSRQDEAQAKHKQAMRSIIERTPKKGPVSIDSTEMIREDRKR